MDASAAGPPAKKDGGATEVRTARTSAQPSAVKRKTKLYAMRSRFVDTFYDRTGYNTKQTTRFSMN